MNALSYLRTEIDWAHELLAMTMIDVTPEMAQVIPSGVANPLGAIYAHAILAEDGIINGLLKQSSPLFASSWVGKTGVAAPQMQLTLEWARSLKPDLQQLGEYAQAVYKATFDYLSTLSDGDLDRELDLSGVGLGQRTLGWALAALVVGHMSSMVGEISCLKGLQGAKGYPF